MPLDGDALRRALTNEEAPADEEYDDSYTLCHDCNAQFYPGEEGFDADECFECGGYTDTYDD